MSKFKVDDHVKIVNIKHCASKYPTGTIGKTGVITKVDELYRTYKYVLKLDDGTTIEPCINWFSDMELELVQEPPKYLTKIEAIKKAIEGYKIRPIDRDVLIIWFDIKCAKFFYRHTFDGELAKTEVNALIDNQNDKWEVITEEEPVLPKFSKGELFISPKGRLGVILSEPEYIDGTYRYSVRFRFDIDTDIQPYNEEYMTKYVQA